MSSFSEDEQAGDDQLTVRHENGSEDGSVYEDDGHSAAGSSESEHPSAASDLRDVEVEDEAEDEAENVVGDGAADGDLARRAAKDKKSDKTKRQKKRHARNREGTLYDAVAGRLGAQGFIAGKNTKYLPLRPDEVLFSRKDAPVRYEEDDIYFQNRHLPEPSPLPNSDLLKAIHTYVSDFYGSGHLGDTSKDFRSLDETALIAIGVLLEESAKKALGETGDLAFTEGSADNEPEA